jgi:hypothetical protein
MAQKLMILLLTPTAGDDEDLSPPKKKRGRPPKPAVIKPVELFTAAVLPSVVPKLPPLQPLPSLLPPPHLSPPIIPSSVRDSKQEDRISQLVMKVAVLEKNSKCAIISKMQVARRKTGYSIFF